LIPKKLLIAVATALGNNCARLNSHSGEQLMTNKLQTALKVGALTACVAIASGCATITQEQLDAVRATAEKAASDATAAASAASAAERAANEARQMASGAQSTANQALSAANASQACCDATNEKIDRMFQRSMSK
jgi:hypothetical protein